MGTPGCSHTQIQCTYPGATRDHDPTLALTLANLDRRSIIDLATGFIFISVSLLLKRTRLPPQTR